MKIKKEKKKIKSIRRIFFILRINLINSFTRMTLINNLNYQKAIILPLFQKIYYNLDYTIFEFEEMDISCRLGKFS